MTTGFLLIAMAALSSNDFQATLNQLRDRQEVPGVSATVVRGKDVLFAGGSGVADLQTERPMTADTVLYAGSLSKVFTAALTLQLIHSGELDLQQELAAVAESGANDKARPRLIHLLTHSSGLVREGDFGYWFSGNFPSQETLASFLRNTELQNDAGSQVSYSNIGYAAIGQIIERETGRTYADALSARVLLPLGLNSSGVPGPAENVAVGYSPVGRIIPSADKPFAGVGKAIAGRHVREYHDARAMSPAFGVYTTANDLGRLARFLTGFSETKIFSDQLRSMLFEPIRSGRAVAFRIGQFNSRPVARHDGWFAAHRSHLLIDLDAAIAVIVLANSDSASPGKIAEALLDVALTQEP